MHCMIDLETFGTSPGCALRSIGACVFDPRSIGFGDTFYTNIDKQSCLDYGLIVDPRTEQWWEKQSQEAQNALLEDAKPLGEALHLFSNWFAAHRIEKVWCQGANFDAPLLEDALRATGNAIPWKYYNVRDTRTVYDLAFFNPKNIPNVGTHHNALDDCRHQIICVQTAMSRLEFRG